MRTAVALIAAAWPEVALACPDCAPSRAARSNVLQDPAFVTHLFELSLPLLLIVALAAILHVLMRGSTEGAQE